MSTYIALLRGVNVGGITVKSADLAEVFRSLGFVGVRTVLASGNVVFQSDDTDERELTQRIENALRERFGYDARIVLVRRDKLSEVVSAFPFDADQEGWHPYVVFGSGAERLAELLAGAPTLDPADESVVLGDGVLYWHLRVAVGSTKSPFAKYTATARAKPTATNTTRNLRTLRKLL